jgi:hypothetical protein
MAAKLMGQLSVSKDLMRALYRTQHYQATDPRDKVFALLGMFEDAKEAG